MTENERNQVWQKDVHGLSLELVAVKSHVSSMDSTLKEFRGVIRDLPDTIEKTVKAHAEPITQDMNWIKRIGGGILVVVSGVAITVLSYLLTKLITLQ